MNIKDIEAVIAVVDNGSITRAAKKLFVTQPSLSQCIQRVETELNATLFIRTKNGIELTSAGKAFIEYAERICKECRDLENTLVDISEMRAGHLSVGIPTLLNGYLLPEGYMYFRKHYPHVKVDLCEDDSSNLELMLCRGKIDLAIMSMPIDPSLISVPMISCEMLLCAPDWFHPGNSLLDPKTHILDIRKLNGQPFIIPQSSQKLHMLTDKILKKAGISVQNVLTTRSSKGAMLYSAFGLGFTLQPMMSVLFHQSILKGHGQLFRIPPELNERWTVVMARCRNGYFSEAARCFIRSMQEFYSGIPPLEPGKMPVQKTS